jgi:putative endonuclease
MKYVYLLQSVSRPDQRYVGITEDLKERLSHHNSGRSPHTSRFMPWQIAVAIRFNDDRKAAAFERYLKSGSGHAFAIRHPW